MTTIRASMMRGPHKIRVIRVLPFKGQTWAWPRSRGRHRHFYHPVTPALATAAGVKLVAASGDVSFVAWTDMPGQSYKFPCKTNIRYSRRIRVRHGHISSFMSSGFLTGHIVGRKLSGSRRCRRFCACFGPSGPYGSGLYRKVADFSCGEY